MYYYYFFCLKKNLIMKNFCFRFNKNEKKFVSIVNKSKMNFINFLFIILFSLIQINSMFGERIEILMSNVTTQKVRFIILILLFNFLFFFLK